MHTDAYECMKSAASKHRKQAQQAGTASNHNKDSKQAQQPSTANTCASNEVMLCSDVSFAKVVRVEINGNARTTIKVTNDNVEKA